MCYSTKKVNIKGPHNVLMNKHLGIGGPHNVLFNKQLNIRILMLNIIQAYIDIQYYKDDMGYIQSCYLNEN